MNCLRTLSIDNSLTQLKLNSVAYAIRVDLGYCCEWLFFQLYPDAGLVALRLGVTTDTIRRHKRKLKKASCSGYPYCMKKCISEELFPKESV